MALVVGDAGEGANLAGAVVPHSGEVWAAEAVPQQCVAGGHVDSVELSSPPPSSREAVDLGVESSEVGARGECCEDSTFTSPRGGLAPPPKGQGSLSGPLAPPTDDTGSTPVILSDIAAGDDAATGPDTVATIGNIHSFTL